MIYAVYSGNITNGMYYSLSVVNEIFSRKRMNFNQYCDLRHNEKQNI